MFRSHGLLSSPLHCTPRSLAMIGFLTSEEEGQTMAPPRSSFAKRSSVAACADFDTSEEESAPAPKSARDATNLRVARKWRVGALAVPAKQTHDLVKYNFDTSEEETVSAPTVVEEKGRGRKVGRGTVRKKPAASQKQEAKVEAEVGAKPEPRGEFAPMSLATPKTTRPLPKSSGAFEFARWAMTQLTPAEVSALAKDSDLTIRSVWNHWRREHCHGVFQDFAPTSHFSVSATIGSGSIWKICIRAPSSSRMWQSLSMSS